MPLDGILLIDKSTGMTSHDVVAILRKILHIKKFGHSGTLDPLATGLLITLIGKGTKLSDSLIGLPKTYEGVIKLGMATDSYDAEGAVTSTAAVPPISNDTLDQLANDFIGEQYQVPPMFSAKKINGQKLYKLARAGKTVERPPQLINIYDFKITNFDGSEMTFFVHCSKGTYVRTLANDIGIKLGCGAHLKSLRRTTIGNFSVENALTLDSIRQLSYEEILNHVIWPHEL